MFIKRCRRLDGSKGYTLITGLNLAWIHAFTIRRPYMRMKIVVIFLTLLIVSSCYTGTRTVAPEGQPAVKNMNGTEGLDTKLKISGDAQVFALTNIDAPAGFRTVDVKNNEWSFYLVRFNLQALPLNREEIKSTYFSVDFKIEDSALDSTKKVIIDKLYPTSTSRQVYGFQSDITAGGEVGLSAEGGYGWSLTDKKEKKDSGAEEKGRKENLTEKLVITQKEKTTVTEEIPDESGNNLKKVKTTTTEKANTSETEKYDKKSLDASLIRTIEKITDINLTTSARGKAYFDASAKFAASYKKEKWEPLITAVGSLSQRAQWLDRQPFQNGDKYFSVILKVRKPERNLTEFLNTANLKSKKDQVVDWIDQDKRQLDRYKIILRSISKEYLHDLFSEDEIGVIDKIKAEIKELEKKTKDEKEGLSRSDFSEDQIIGYIHDHIKLLYKYQSFAEVYDEALKNKLKSMDNNTSNEAQKLAVSYQIKQLEKYGKDILIIISKRELDLYNIYAVANAHVVVDGNEIKCETVKIDLNEPERLISIVIE